MLAAVGAVYVILAVMLWLWMSDRPLLAHRLSGDSGQERTAEEAASGQQAERGQQKCRQRGKQGGDGFVHGWYTLRFLKEHVRRGVGLDAFNPKSIFPLKLPN